MDHAWKYVSVLIVFNLALTIWFYVTVSGDFTARPSLPKIPVNRRGKTSTDSQTRVFTSTGTVNSKTSLLKTHTKQLSKSKMVPLSRLEKRLQTNETTYNLTDVKFANNKTLDFHLENEAHQYQTPDITRKNKSSCTFSFDSESLKRAKEKLSKPFYLFRIKLEVEGFQNLPRENLDALLHWQYVLKQEKILVQLPVDFDLISFTLLYIDNEETKLDVKLIYNNSKCFQDDFSKTLLSIRFLLWNELFLNDTKYYLCNRYYEESGWRTFQYFFTTIWVGYDLTCSEMSSKHGLYKFQLKKDLPGTSAICFLLSLQFVWIFALLDIKNRNMSPNLIAKSSTFPFSKRDRPYGPMRFFFKLLSCKCCCCCTDQTKRLIFLMWIFILLPFGFCRTVLRPIFNEISTVGPSEPFFSFIPIYSVGAILALDVFYAIFCPLIYICLGHAFYLRFSKDDLHLCSCFPENNDDHTLIKNNTRVIDRFTFRFYQFCNTLQANCYKNNCKNCNNCCCACRKCCNNCANCCSCFCFFLRNACRSISSFIYCLFPIIPFNYYDVYSKYCNDINDDGCSTNNTCCCNKSSCCMHCKIATCKQIIKVCLNCICFLITYFLCLRPTISTFTFLFRSFTYFVFVALPIRAHIMRIMLIVVTTVFYFLRYFHEIINMNAEILNYIFKLEDEHTILMNDFASNASNASNASEEESNVKTIDEKVFDYIYDKVMFVKKSYYFLFLKMIVVIMYLIITIETYLSNTQSLTGANFKDMMEFLLIIIGPYAISVFLKTNKDGFLTEENESEIKLAYKIYYKSANCERTIFPMQEEESIIDMPESNVNDDDTDETKPLIVNTTPKNYNTV